MEKLLKYIWLTLRKVSPIKLMSVYQYFCSAESIYQANDYSMIYGLKENDIASLKDKSLKRAEEIYRSCIECGARIITIDDESYPELLRHTSNPPYVLYIKGINLDLNKEFCIGVVGTRKSTQYGANVAVSFCTQMAKHNITVVSGMAMGIDSIAAHSAMKAGGKTIAVLGCGVDVAYPLSNKELYNEIEQKGMIISEYPPGTVAMPWRFPRRNRIIAGISRGVTVIEGSEKSGSLITANLAAEYGRDVFAVPRNIDVKGLGGTNYLIKQGAVPMTEIDDLLKSYPEIAKQSVNSSTPYEYEQLTFDVLDEISKQSDDTQQANKPHKSEEKMAEIFSVIKRTNSDEEKAILEFISDTVQHIDNIAEGTGITADVLNTKLLMLEINGMIEQLPGKCFRIRL